MPFNPPRQSTLYNPYAAIFATVVPAPDAIARSGRMSSSLLLPGLYHVGQLMEFAFTDQIPVAGVLISNSNNATRPSCLSTSSFVIVRRADYPPVGCVPVLFPAPENYPLIFPPPAPHREYAGLPVPDAPFPPPSAPGEWSRCHAALPVNDIGIFT